MIFKQLHYDGCLSYITACDTELVGAVIDPSHDLDSYLEFIKENNLKIQYVIDTHTHVDHVSLGRELADALGSTYAMHKNVTVQRAAQTPVSPSIDQIIAKNASIPVDTYLDTGDRLQLGGVFLEVMYTPGHTKDSICLKSNGRLYTGDTLMIGQCGRTDLPGGSSSQLFETIFNLILELPDDLLIYPAHDYKGNINTSLGYERVNNLYMRQGKSVEEFSAFLKSMTPPLNTDGGKIQCSLGMTKESEVGEITPLMKSFCISMEHYLAHPLDSILISPNEFLKQINDKENVFIIDVRELAELASGFISGARNIPVGQVAARIEEMPSETNYPIVVVCESGVRSAYAALYLRGLGYINVRNLEFGMNEWRARNYPLDFPR